MLPLELLSTVAANLSRAELGDLQQVHVICRDLVARDFAEVPRVRVRQLRVNARGSYDFLVPCADAVSDDQCTDDQWCSCSNCHYMHNIVVHCASDDEFERRMKFCAVENICFTSDSSFHMDRALVHLLSRFRATWADGTVEAPSRFDSEEVFRTAFDEAFRCKSLRISAFDGLPFHPAPRVFELEAVRRCHKLEAPADETLDPVEVTEWLCHVTTGNRPKMLLLNMDQRETAPVVNRLRENFHAATEPVSYRVEIHGRCSGVEQERAFNKRTLESLQIDIGWMGRKVIMERKGSE